MSGVIAITAHPAVVDDTGEPLRHHVAGVPYVRAVERAGGIPVILPVVDRDRIGALLDRVDAVVITGGADIDPARYGAAAHPETAGVNAERDAADLALATTLVERDFPTLAICRGVQVLNVALGGSLDQHRPEHMQRDRYNDTAHSVTIDSSSRLASIVGSETLGVNTLHHQAIANLGNGLRVVARAEDGTVEAVEVEGAPHVLGVQWHPEMLRHRAEHLALFGALLA
jgi:putative glutamine amidotransferase